MNRDAKRLCGLEVDDQLDFCGLDAEKAHDQRCTKTETPALWAQRPRPRKTAAI